MKLMDLEFANDLMTAEGQAVDKSAPKKWRADAAAEKAEAFRKGRL
jgi:excinuclease ABC subunit B